MEYKTYKVKQGQYHEIVDSTITIPDGLKLITEEDQLGGWLHEGNKHYFGIIKGDLTQMEDNLKGLHVYPEQFGEYVLISILNIKFIEPYPYMVSEEEFNREFDLSSYYIARYDDELRITDMKKIVKIHSQFNVEVLVVDRLGINTYMNVDISDVISGKPFLDQLQPKVVSGKIAEDYWRTMINETLVRFNLHLEQPNRTVDLDYIHHLFTHGDFNEIDKYIKMEVAKYI